jgi:hypothetical protein
VVSDLHFADLKRTTAPTMGELNGWVSSGLDLLSVQAMIDGSAEAQQKNGM